ncbi:unnamed protein product [Polarella glacialis]|uniref:Uncharacterized protein n=1 Tax=Polarella glacialis TaxID=89957 RepID=A0A813LJW8_POLGL|nr:unnamed protein product [Polarella glacialis]CAE8733086.1 unnamed protein product [Polarella glacialis]
MSEVAQLCQKRSVVAPEIPHFNPERDLIEEDGRFHTVAAGGVLDSACARRGHPADLLRQSSTCCCCPFIQRMVAKVAALGKAEATETLVQHERYEQKHVCLPLLGKPLARGNHLARTVNWHSTGGVC